VTETTSDATLSNLSRETRRFEPPEEFAAAANLTAEAYDRAAADRLGFWEEQARRLTWSKPWDEVLQWDLPFAKWFVGGELNASYNCVDRHVEAGRGDKVAFHWEGERGHPHDHVRRLLRDVCRAANALTSWAWPGDRVAIYMR
jgi:acetyl-CoA synthetase